MQNYSLDGLKTWHLLFVLCTFRLSANIFSFQSRCLSLFDSCLIRYHLNVIRSNNFCNWLFWGKRNNALKKCGLKIRPGNDVLLTKIYRSLTLVFLCIKFGRKAEKMNVRMSFISFTQRKTNGVALEVDSFGFPTSSAY